MCLCVCEGQGWFSRQIVSMFKGPKEGERAAEMEPGVGEVVGELGRSQSRYLIPKQWALIRSRIIREHGSQGWGREQRSRWGPGDAEEVDGGPGDRSHRAE